MITLLAARCRWIEPIGQLIVLTAVAFQLFSVSPAIEASSQATAAYTQALLKEVLLQGQDKSGHARSDLAIQRDQVALKDAQAIAADKKAKADTAKEYAAGIYIGLFIFGTLLAIAGKLASVAYGTKSPPSNSKETSVPPTPDPVPTTADGAIAARTPASV